MDNEKSALRLDYELTSSNFSMLADIRLKLLALIPTIAGVALGFAKSEDGAIPELQALGILGFIATSGVILYELRNTQLYDATLQRMRVLEGQLRFKSTRSTSKGPGGVHLDRPPRSHVFVGLPVVHDFGLGLIYGSALGAWAFVISLGAHIPDEFSFSIAGVVAYVVMGELVRIDDRNELVRQIPSRIQRDLKLDGKIDTPTRYHGFLVAMFWPVKICHLVTKSNDKITDTKSEEK